MHIQSSVQTARVETLFHGTDPVKQNSGNATAQDAISSGKKDVDALKKELAVKQEILKGLGKEPGNFNVELKVHDAYDNTFAAKGWEVVSNKPEYVIENGELKSAPRTSWNAKAALAEAQAIVAERKVEFDKLQEEIKALEEKIEKAEEGEGYSFLGCLISPFTFTWSILKNVGNFFYNLICCKYGAEDATDNDENKSAPKA